MSIVKAAGYDPGVYLMDALPAGGFKGQPVYIQRQPVTFKENANRSRTMFFSHLAHGMGKIRELACWPVQDPMRVDLAEGHALVTNHSRLDIVGEVRLPGSGPGGSSGSEEASGGSGAGAARGGSQASPGTADQGAAGTPDDVCSSGMAVGRAPLPIVFVEPGARTGALLRAGSARPRSPARSRSRTPTRP